MKVSAILNLLSTLGALTMAATPLVAITATAHAATLNPAAVTASLGDTAARPPVTLASR